MLTCQKAAFLLTRPCAAKYGRAECSGFLGLCQALVPLLIEHQASTESGLNLKEVAEVIR